MSPAERLGRADSVGGACFPAAQSKLASRQSLDETASMNLAEADQDFLRDLVKTSRQRPHHVRWVDRDGSERITTLSPPDAARLNALAHQLHLSKEALLREGAQLPVKRLPKPQD